tara:strand:+ start:70 stop:1035 length:966 start_codon:yes stop_codon:yes gene_type:complete
MQNSHFHELKKKNEEEEKRKKNEIEKSKWTNAQELLLAEWAEKAACYRWLHSRAEKYYRCRNYLFTIPVIILSTLTGTANFAMDSFVPDENKKMAMGIVGGVNIFAGILSTLQNFLRYAELMESHRAVSVSWSKFARNITVELALDEKRRKPANDFLKLCRAEFDRLIEQAPLVEDDIIKLFKKKFDDIDIIKPEICNGLHKCVIYKASHEEKVANIVANASDKLHVLKNKSFKRLQIKQTNNLDNQTTVVNSNDENIKLINNNFNNGSETATQEPSIDGQPMESLDHNDIVINVDNNNNDNNNNDDNDNNNDNNNNINLE